MKVFYGISFLALVILQGAYLCCFAGEAAARKTGIIQDIKGEELERAKEFIVKKGLFPVSKIYKLAQGQVYKIPAAVTMRYTDEALQPLSVKEESLALYGITPASSSIRKLGNQVLNKRKNEISAEVATAPQYIGILGRAEPGIIPPKADITPPRTYAAFTIPGSNGIYSASALIIIDPYDPVLEGFVTSGIDKVWYSVNKKDGAMGTQLYTKPFQLAEGKHTLYYRGVDKAGNFEVLNSSPVYIDGTPPRTTVTVKGEGRVEGGSVYVVSGSSLALTAVDPESKGISSTIGMVMFTVGDKDCTELTSSHWSRKPGICPAYMYTGPVALPDGKHTFYYASMDWAGNMEKLNKVSVTVGARKLMK